MSLLHDSVPEVLVPWRSCGISFLRPEAQCFSILLYMAPYVCQPRKFLV